MEKKREAAVCTIDIDGQQFRWSENRLRNSSYKSKDIALRQQDLKNYLRRLNATADDYVNVIVDGVETRMYTGGKEYTQEQLDGHCKRIRDNIEAVRIETTTDENGKPNGVKAIYYIDLVNTPHAKALKLLEDKRNEYTQADDNMDVAVLDAEYDYIEVLAEMLFDYKRFNDLLKVDPRSYKVPGEATWEHGRMNNRVNAILTAIDKVYHLDYSFDMMRGCGLGTLSNWLGVPYLYVIHYINTTYIQQ